ncbi:MAG: hypothetical protein ROR55_08945 [Devosia sp.]
MDFEALFANFQYEDLQWFIPVLAGLVIILGGLLIGIVRGMTAGVLLALLFGGLMSMSPVLLNALQRGTDPAVMQSAEVARGAAELSILNSQVMTDMSRVVTTLRTAMETITPVVAPEGEEGENAVVAQRFAQGLSDTEERLDAAIDTLSRANVMRQRLEDDLQSLQVELRRGTR